MPQLVVYQAATVLLAQRFGPSESLAFSNRLGNPSAAWDKAIQLLKAYSQVGESAKRCVAALEILSAKFHHHVSHNQVRQDGYASIWTNKAESNAPQESRGPYGELEDLSGDLDLSGVDLDDFDLNFDDMMWLNTSAGDVLF